MTRPLLGESAIHPAVRQRIAEHHLSVIQQVQTAIGLHPARGDQRAGLDTPGGSMSHFGHSGKGTEGELSVP